MTTINDALAREIIHASVSGGAEALGHYHSPSHASAVRALAGRRSRPAPGLEIARRLAAALRSSFAAPAVQPACCPAA